MNLKLTFSWRVHLPHDLPLNLPELSEKESINFESQIDIFCRGRSATWSAWAVREGIYQYESQISIFWGGSRSTTWSAWAVRVGVYQYESQIDIFWGVHLPLDLPELSEWESISLNLKLPFLGGEICHLICLSCQSRNLSVWISNCHFWEGRSATWSALAVRVGINVYESQIAIFWGDTSATWSAWALRVGIYQYESQIDIFWEDLLLDLPELSE